MDENIEYSALDSLRPYIRFYHPFDPALDPRDEPESTVNLPASLRADDPKDEHSLAERLERCPAAHYLLGLRSPASRRSQAVQLRKIAHINGAWDWHLVDWTGIREMAFTRILSTLMEDDLSPSSFNARRAALRGVLKAGVLIEVVDEKVYRHCRDLIKRMRSDHLVEAGRYISVAEQKTAVEDLSTASSENAAPRNTAILRIALDLGLRRSEIATIQTDHLNLDERLLKVTGKGGKTRYMPIPTESLDALEAWLAVRGSWPGPLFCRIYKSGKIGKVGLSSQAVYNLVEIASSGLKTRFSPHDCRGTFVSDVIEATGDLSIAQDLAGHSNITTTTLYDRRGAKVRARAIAQLSEYRRDLTPVDDDSDSA